MKTPLLKSGLALVAVVRCLQPATGEDLHSFQRLQLNDQFGCEGANFGDLNHDGKDDVISGPWWYEGPDFQKRHEFHPATTTFSLKLGPLTPVTVPGFEGGLGVANRYSDNFFVWTPDLNRDGWNDILVIVSDARLRLQWRRAERHRRRQQEGDLRPVAWERRPCRPPNGTRLNRSHWPDEAKGDVG